MTVEEAIETVRSSGRVELEAGQIRCQVPRSRPPQVETALTVIRQRKPEALKLLEQKPLEQVLKGTAKKQITDALGVGVESGHWTEEKGRRNERCYFLAESFEDIEILEF